LFYLRSVAPKEVKTTDIYWGAVPFVLIQVLMVALIIGFPRLVSVAAKTDMKEQIQLNIDLKQDNGSSAPSDQKDDAAPKLDFSSDTDKKDSSPPAAPAKEGEKKDGEKKDSDKKDDGGLQLNFSTDTDKK